jgi:VanZ family protein
MNPVHPLRFYKLWLIIGWFLIAFVIVLSLMPPLPSSTPLFNLPYGDKIGHCTAYFILMGWFAQIYFTPQQRRYCLIGFIAMGILLELLQGLEVIRHADWKDALANSVGVVLAWQMTKTHARHLLLHFEQRFLS